MKLVVELELKLGVLTEPVLVGREKELEEQQRYLDSAFEGKRKTDFSITHISWKKTT